MLLWVKIDPASAADVGLPTMKDFFVSYCSLLHSEGTELNAQGHWKHPVPQKI